MNINREGHYVDATFGRGGHSREILARLGTTGSLLVTDRDPDAIEAADKEFGGDRRVQVRQASFSTLEATVADLGMQAAVDGLLLDLGVSSPQLDDADRGFSFTRQGPLDMRMDPGTGMSAARWVSTAGEREISQVLRDYGEEKFHRRIARAIVQARDKDGSAIVTTTQLADLVSRVRPVRERNRHAATRTFQAIRIFVNRELDELQACLEQSLRILAPGGRLVVISFHSLEDRIVKRFMRNHSKPDAMYAGMPEIPPEALPVLRLVGKAVRSGVDEVARNPRSRSAVMRVAERLP